MVLAALQSQGQEDNFTNGPGRPHIGFLLISSVRQSQRVYHSLHEQVAHGGKHSEWPAVHEHSSALLLANL